MDLLHDDPHPPGVLVVLAHFDDVRVAQQTYDLDFVSQEFLFFHCELGFIDFFEGVGLLGPVVCGLENIGEFAAAQAFRLSVELLQ